ncbi:MAG: hypothetical protein ACFNYB_06075 [Campylobacter sp.]
MKSRNFYALPAVNAEKYGLKFKLCVVYKFRAVSRDRQSSRLFGR